MAVEPDTGIQYLKGIGERRAQLFHRLGIDTVGELMAHYPREYIDLTDPTPAAAAPFGEPVAVRAVVTGKSGEQRIRGGLSLFKVQAADGDGTGLTLTFFNGKFTVEKLRVGEEYLFYGRVTGTLLRREMASPMIFPLAGAGGLFPVYPLTAGLTSRMVAGAVKQALAALLERIPETLPAGLKARYRLCHIQYAVENIHFPPSREAMLIARRRLIFEELFTLTLALSAVREGREGEAPVRLHPVDLRAFLASLPFTLTPAQLRAVEEIAADLAGETPMNRLLQGDVGSGKTVVAACGCVFAAENGAQSALMAPTEILAAQHFETMQTLLGPFGVRVALLTGSTRAAEKRRIREGLAAGEIDLVVGTHALLSEGIDCRRLALVITDEQHRFGVGQRTALGRKGQGQDGEIPHTLVMSATPIPRTLALMIYGDLDISVIDTMPVGRLPVKTYAIDSPKRERAYGFIRKHLDQGYQAYVICPLVEPGEQTDPKLVSAAEYAERLRAGAFAGYRVGLLHGRMKAADKEETMLRFKNGEIDLLVATTVVEVGVDVPNAVVMLIENAERFGLSQLHQLRGRVGRGAVQSYCILLSDSRGPDARARLSTMCRTTSGFAVAEEDLRLRGPGDFFGQRQHGLPQFALADLSTDVELLADARAAAEQLLKADPRLERPEHRPLREKVERMLREIGGQPN
ncbi:MAG: ATP-dependent DNA helicase RecG [Clostridiales bacterium]|nr:ATP-dependent DNA helicase RecG [Clostridiales bacterium]